ncbi:hypothetical protein JCM8547_002767 [Rhodosporidiobolus lusitaniae]
MLPHLLPLLTTLLLSLSSFASLASAQRRFGGNRGGAAAGGGAAGGGGGNCPPVQMIVARASTEPPGEGIIGAVADGVKQQIPGAESVAVDYPATLGNYANSEAQGVDAMVELIEQQNAKCPGGKIVLMGYSQGAQVTGDVLSGGATGTGGGRRRLGRRQLPANTNVVAVVMMGDPTFSPGQPFNVGSNQNRAGVFERQNNAALEAMADNIQSFCDNGDTFCASGNSLATHLGYVREFETEATDFIVQKAA